MGLIRAQETLSRSTEVFLENTWVEMTVVAGGGGDDPPSANPRAPTGHQVCGPNPRTLQAWQKVGRHGLRAQEGQGLMRFALSF